MHAHEYHENEDACCSAWCKSKESAMGLGKSKGGAAFSERDVTSSDGRDCKVVSVCKQLHSLYLFTTMTQHP